MASEIILRDQNFVTVLAGVTDNSALDIRMLRVNPSTGRLLVSGVGGGGAVDSVNGQTGIVVLDTDDISEGSTNLYYTNARARAAISLTTTGSSGAATYNNVTGVLNIPQYALGAGFVPYTGATSDVNLGDHTITFEYGVPGDGAYIGASVDSGVGGLLLASSPADPDGTLQMLNQNTGFSVYEFLTNLTADRFWIYPDDSGVYASQTYVSTSITTAVASCVPYTGATTDVNIGSHTLIVGPFAGAAIIGVSLNELLLVAPEGNTAGTIAWRTYGGNTRTFNATVSTGSRAYEFPDADGTFVLSINGITPDTEGNVTLTIGTGDVVGPGSSTDNAITRFDSTTGKLIQNSTVTLGDTGIVVGLRLGNGGFIGDANGNEGIILVTTASAVNEITVTNAATGNAPIISATGGDTNIDLKLTAKGTGKVAPQSQLNMGAHTAYFTETDNGNSGTTDTIDWGVSNKQKSTLTGNVTYTFTAPPGPASLILKLVQDGTGGRTVTWPSAVHWPSGTAPTLTTTAGQIDIVSFYYDGTNYYGNYSLNFTP